VVGPGAALSERRLVALIGAVYAFNVLDFMMVMPLGPDFARALGIPSSHLGLVGGSYTAAASVAGVAGAFFLDRFDRRRALAVALAGLVLGTLAGGFAVGLYSLLAARIIAGAFGGPATALSLAIISDAVPPDRRGRVMGSVMGSFAIASVLGVPAGLELARLGGWRSPFFTFAALGAVITGVVVAMLPPLRGHLDARRPEPTPFRVVLRRPIVILALLATALGVIAHFSLIPNLSAYFQFNRGYPREHLGILYMVGGTVSFFTMRLGGWMTDRYGAPAVATAGGLGFAAVLLVGFIEPIAWIPVLAIFVGFMVSGSFRFVPMQALSSRVPEPAERARFMSAQSAVQHAASAIGAIAGAQFFLSERPDGGLNGMDVLAGAAAVTVLILPIVLLLIDRRLRARAVVAPAIVDVAPPAPIGGS
jgi:predicted MFS family arabinose efflux permease